MKGLGQLMKQAQEMQANMQKAQDELASIEVQGEAGGGMVKVTVTCKYEVRRVTIEDSLLQDDKDMLEDLIAAAFNDANRKLGNGFKLARFGANVGIGSVDTVHIGIDFANIGFQCRGNCNSGSIRSSAAKGRNIALDIISLEAGYHDNIMLTDQVPQASGADFKDASVSINAIRNDLRLVAQH